MLRFLKTILMSMVVLVVLVAGLAAYLFFNGQISSPMPIPEADRLPEKGLRAEVTPAEGEAPSQGIMKIIYVHGIGCHNPDYSLPFQLRFAERLGLKRKKEEDGRTLLRHLTFEATNPLETDFWEVQPSYNRLSRAHVIEDPTSPELVASTWYTSRIPDSNFKKKDFDKRYATLINDQFDGEGTEISALGTFRDAATETTPVQNYADFVDHCIGRHEEGIRKSGIPVADQQKRLVQSIEAGLVEADTPANMQRRLPGVTVRDFVPTDPSVHKYHTYRFYEVFWSPLSQPEKERWLRQDFHANAGRSDADSDLTATAERALGNRGVKDAVLNAGIPDAVFYVGAGKERIRRFVATGVCYAAKLDDLSVDGIRELTCDLSRTPSSATDRLLFFSESLGSRVLFDSLASLATASNIVVEQSGQTNEYRIRIPLSALNSFIDTLAESRFYMFANQLPLLEIGLADFEAGANMYADTPLVDLSSLGASFDPSLSQVDRCIMDAGKNLLVLRSPSPVGNWRNTILQADTEYLTSLIESEGLELAEVKYAWVQSIFYLLAVSDCRAAELQLTEEYASVQTRSLDDMPMEVAEKNTLLAKLELVRRMRAELEGAGPLALDLMLQSYSIFRFSDEKSNGDTPLSIADTLKFFEDGGFQVLAFSDPNDLLTYELNDEFRRHFTMIDFVNVPMRVAVPMIPVEGQWGIFANPTNAHLNYRFSKQTMDLIIEGDCAGCSTRE